MSARATLPITVLGGYLGAGKTTLVNHLLREAAAGDGPRLAVLVNEFGALPIDAALIETEEEDVIALAGGCVCCSYGSDLMLALDALARREPRPEHVLLEASGVALPAAVAASLSLLPDCARDGVVVLVDAETVVAHLADRYVADTVARQLADADLVVLNKVDLVDAAMLATVRGTLAGHTAAPLLEAEQARLPPALVLGPPLAPPLSRGARTRSAAGTAGHRAPFVTRSFPLSRAVDPEALARALLEAEPGLARAKGFVRDARGGIAALQIVGRRWRVTAGEASSDTGLVCIGVGALTELEGAAALLADG